MLIAVRAVLLALLLALFIVPHVIIRALTGRSPLARTFLRIAGWIMGLRVQRVGPKPPVRSLLLANHPSWLDIPVLIGATGCAFVSKAEVRNHWLVGWLADQRDTLYVNRDKRSELKAQVAAIRERFDHYLPLAICPEGTTSDGVKLRPFRPALLSAVAPPPDGAKIIPVAIDYGDDREFVSWTAGETGVENAKRILSRWRPIGVKVRMLDPLDPALDRKAMAATAYEAIADALGPSSRGGSAL
ncbi:lysophospholipid acyltransferase family protein [Sphingomicrobium clamense]|uniref:1-acyl-sn-glycerol-3-phosphate acyltransferase n=1 Tax=Sphingomicrobium clamense TaxID=2851013 RepID=A0ABS6V8T9_9SPHN|nr:lysophospholipid acyltransferase family protein [Sphingomicrobium sp. B8]MBW0145582.1 1-acyl-sn-glycerol-3-phosphate acyltransferase [Sphingomicrobium sp. B8]